MEHKSILDNLKHNWILASIVTIVVGLLLVIFPVQVMSVATYVLGTLSLIAGLAGTVQYFKQKHSSPYLFQSDLVVGLLTLGFGIFMITSPESMMYLLPYIFGFLLAGCAVGNILRAIDAKKSGFEQWIVLLVMAIIALITAVLIIFNPFTVLDTLVIIIGAGLIFEGVTDIVITLWVSKRIEDWKKSEQLQ